MANLSTKKLLRLKDDIQRAKDKRASLEGKRDALLEELERDFNVETPEEAEKLIAKLDKRAEKLGDKIHDEIKALEEMGVEL